MTSIQRRLSYALGTICCLLWLGGSVAAYLAARGALVATFDLALKTDIQALANMTEQNETGIRFDSTGEFMPKFRREDRPDYFELWEPDGSALYRSPSLADSDLSLDFGTLEAPRFWNVTLPDGSNGRAAGIRFAPKEDEDTPRSPNAPPLAREVTIVAEFHRAEVDQRLRYLGSLFLVVGIALAALTVVAVNWVIRRGLRPLAALAQRAETIDASSLQVRFPTENIPSELRPIAERLNSLLGRLETSFARERRFSADVAHELRTPIAELRSLAEVALKWPEDRQSAEQAFREARNVALQMESIATGLMALARCENSSLSLHPEPVSLGGVLHEALQPLEAKARAKELAIELEIPTGATWHTDRTILRSIVGNLLANAIDHTARKTSVTARFDKNGAGERLLFSNPAESLMHDDLPNLFERFWQKDAARSSPDHSGLGLALAKAYAHSLGMSLDAEITGRDIIFALSQPEARNGTN